VLATLKFTRIEGSFLVNGLKLNDELSATINNSGSKLSLSATLAAVRQISRFYHFSKQKLMNFKAAEVAAWKPSGMEAANTECLAQA